MAEVEQGMIVNSVEQIGISLLFAAAARGLQKMIDDRLGRIPHKAAAFAQPEKEVRLLKESISPEMSVEAACFFQSAALDRHMRPARIEHRTFIIEIEITDPLACFRIDPCYLGGFGPGRAVYVPDSACHCFDGFPAMRGQMGFKTARPDNRIVIQEEDDLGFASGNPGVARCRKVGLWQRNKVNAGKLGQKLLVQRPATGGLVNHNDLRQAGATLQYGSHCAPQKSVPVVGWNDNGQSWVDAGHPSKI